MSSRVTRLFRSFGRASVPVRAAILVTCRAQFFALIRDSLFSASSREDFCVAHREIVRVSHFSDFASEKIACVAARVFWSVASRTRDREWFSPCASLRSGDVPVIALSSHFWRVSRVVLITVFLGQFDTRVTFSCDSRSLCSVPSSHTLFSFFR